MPAVLLGAVFAAAARAEEAAPDFGREVRPLLARHCFACHGPDAARREAGLRLDEASSATAPLASGSRAIVPGSPRESGLVARIRSPDPAERMPPPGSGTELSDRERSVLEAWVSAGAPFAMHWSHVAPIRRPVPDLGDGAGAVDAFHRVALARAGVEPAAEADPVTLLRRVSFDLTGLPPTAEEVERFLADPSADRWERTVDRLLASPRHAERMATWWLDLVRYADTVGYHGDQDHSASPYRDWVIHAFHANLPFDRFTILQLAGDLVGAGPGEHPDDPLLAGAYNRLLQTTHEGGLQEREYRAIYQADRVRNVSAVWMAASVGCARCHDHKIDPFSAVDYHALAAFFADIDDERHFRTGSNALPTVRDPEARVVAPFDRARAADLAARIAALADSLPPLVLPPRLPADEPADVVAARAELARLEAEAAAIPRRLMVTRPLAEPRPVRVLPRGDWLDDSGPIVQPAIPALFGRLPGEVRRTRADLARWLVRPTAEGGHGEFTARVMANRLWALLFGAGLCRSLEDFGGQGESPDHPELLDRLAVSFVDSGWDLRALLRSIVTSHAYRMRSDVPAEILARDPDNRLLARQGRFRIPAEHVRDTALSVSGLLVERLGGEPVRPWQPAGFYRHLNFPAREYVADADDRRHRRGVYVHWQRTFLHPQLAAFDAPPREDCTAARARSNTPRQALVLLNDPSFVEAARALAARVLRDRDSDDDRLAALLLRTVSRRPDAAERDLLAGLLARRREEYAAAPALASEALVVGGLVPEPGHDPVELAAWTAVARAVLNLHETYARD